MDEGVKIILFVMILVSSFFLMIGFSFNDMYMENGDELCVELGYDGITDYSHIDDGKYNLFMADFIECDEVYRYKLNCSVAKIDKWGEDIPDCIYQFIESKNKRDDEDAD